VRVGVQATFADGQPVPDAGIGLSETGYGIHGGKRTDSKGAVSLTVPRGKRILLMGLGNASSGCLSPAPVGPDNYPRVVHVVYSLDGCREEFNVVHTGLLRASIRGKFSQMPIKVIFPDGSPAYDADVTIESKRPSVPFVSALRTDRNGHIDLPIPDHQEFEVHASIHRTGIDCDSQSLLFHTDTSIRWWEVGSRAGSIPGWSNVTAVPISLMLVGASCRPGT
jgi:hypothetical protein